jgi:RNA polymerase sigma-70 factor (ECF subfamily)
MTDTELIQRFTSGDIGAFDELMRRHEDRVFAICLRILGDREAALDATQDTFVTLFRKADKFSGGSAFTTWLHRVTVNMCYDHLRKLKRRRTTPLPAGFEPADPAATDEFTASELRPDLERALAALPTDFRAAVVLVDLEDLALETAADALQVPVGTIKSRLFRGRRLLAQELRNLRGDVEHQRDDHA